MNTKTITCIECPVGCRIGVDMEGCRVVKVSGNKCPKGEKYAISEIENPMRVLTTTVAAEGLGIRRLPIRTSAPISKAKIPEVMRVIRSVKVSRPVRVGESIVKNVCGTGADIVVTRSVD